MNNRLIFEDIDDAKHHAFCNDFKVFELLRGEKNSFLSHKTEFFAYRSLYHILTDILENNEWGINSIREEGVEIQYKGTDFGLQEVIITKLR
jgi:type II restriction/modification system DNA methylase subunit YeeA